MTITVTTISTKFMRADGGGLRGVSGGTHPGTEASATQAAYE